MVEHVHGSGAEDLGAEPTAAPGLPPGSDGQALGAGAQAAVGAPPAEAPAAGLSDAASEEQQHFRQGASANAHGEGDTRLAGPRGGRALAGAVERTAEESTAEEGVSGETELHRHFMAPALVPLARVDEDDTFSVRGAAPGDVSALATDIARLGQLFPIDVRLRPPDRFQVLTGFRRVAALRLLHRERVLARLHTDLSDDDAMLLTLADAIHARGVSLEALEAVRSRLVARGRLTPAIRDMLDKALAPDSELPPELVEEEVDADELSADVTVRLAQCNQDLSLLADVFRELDPTRRAQLLAQLRYSKDLVAWLEGLE